MKIRIGEAIKILQPRIDAIINKCNKKSDDVADKLLAQNQKDWMTYANSQSQLTADYFRGGSFSPVSYGLHKIEEYEKRIQDLQTYFDGLNKP